MSAEFVLDTPVVRAFVAGIQSTIVGASSPEEACEAIKPRFAELLGDPDWLPRLLDDGEGLLERLWQYLRTAPGA